MTADTDIEFEAPNTRLPLVTISSEAFPDIPSTFHPRENAVVI